MSLLRCILSKNYSRYTQITQFLIACRYLQGNPSRITLRHHYATLNVDANTSVDDIKKAYNKLMKKWHPDMHSSKPEQQQKDAEKQFLLIRESYEAIMNDKQKNQNNAQTHENINWKTNSTKHNYSSEQVNWQNGRYYHRAWDHTNSKPHNDYEYGRDENRRYYHRAWDSTNDNPYDDYDYGRDENGERLWTWYLQEPNWIRFCAISIITFGLLKYIFAPDDQTFIENPKYTTRPAFRGQRYMIYKGERYPLEPRLKKKQNVKSETNKKKSKLLPGQIEVLVYDSNGKMSKKIINTKGFNENSNDRKIISYK